MLGLGVLGLGVLGLGVLGLGVLGLGFWSLGSGAWALGLGLFGGGWRRISFIVVDLSMLQGKSALLGYFSAQRNLFREFIY